MEEDVTPENQLNNIPDCSDIVKDVILTEEVPLEIRKEKEINDLEEQIVEGDSYYTELQKKSAQNQKEIADEISYSDPIPVGNPEVTEVRVDTQKGQDLQAADDISCEPKASSTIGASKPDPKEGTGQSVRISGEVKHCSVEEAPKEERSPALEDVTTSEPQVNLSNIESIASPSESEKLPNQALESVCDEQSPKVVANSEDSKVKEEFLVLATAKYTDENNVEEEHEIITNEISSAEKKEHTTESKQIAEHPSMSCLDAVLIEEELGRSSEHEIATDEGRSVMDPHQDTIADITFSESCQPDTEEKNVKQAPTNSDEAKRSDTNAEEKALTEEKSKITTDNNVKCPSLESQLEHRSEKDSKDGKKGDMEDDGKLTPENQINSTQDLNETKNEAITTEEVKQVPVVIQKENERNEFKEETVEEDSCSKELQKTSNQKEKANEISYIDPIPIANPEVTETRANSQTRQEDLNAEDLNSESEAPSNIEASKTGMKEGIKHVIIIGEVKKGSVNEQPKKERIPAQGDTMTLEPQLNLSSIESPYPPPESKLPIKALESGSNVQNHEIVPKLEDSEVKEEDVLATKEYRDNLDGKHETMADEISNEEKKEQTTYSKQAVEHPSIVCLDAAFVKKELGRSNEHENITSEGRCFEDPYQDSSADRTISEACPKETKEENVKQAPMKSNEVKWSDTNIEAQALTERNLEPYGELKPTSDTAIEDEVNETMPQPEQSEIASENYMKYRTLESKLEHMNAKDLIDVKRDMQENVTLAPENQINSTNNQNETMKNAILTEEIEQVAAEIEKGRNEVKEQVSGEDSYPTEIETTSTSNQKELANEIAYIKQIPVGNYEVTEVRAERQIEVENIQATEDLSWLPKASSTVEASKMEMSEVSGQTVTILGEVKDDSIDEAPKDKRIPALDDAKALELQVNLPELESTGAPSNGQDSMKLREGMPSSTQETIEEKGVLISQLTHREVLEEGAIENRKEAPDHEFEKKEKDNEPQYEIQTPEALKAEMKEKHQEEANDKCETLGGGLSSEKLLDELEEIGAEEDIEVIARGEEKAIEESYRDTVAQVTVHEYLSQKEEKPVSMVPHEELTSPMAEDQTNESVMEKDKTKVESSSKSNKDQNMEFMEEEFTKKNSVDQRSAKEIEEEGQSNLHIENKEAKSGNEAVEDVTTNEVLLEVQKAKESKRIKDDINEEASCIHNQLTSTTDEVCQNKRLNSSPNELLETRGSVEDTEDLKLMAESLNLKAETFTVLKGPKEDMKQKVENTSTIVASEFERLENMLTEENIVKAEANKENEKVDRPDADDPTRTSCDSISNSREQDIEVKSEERRGYGDAHKLEEKPIEVSELTFKGHEIVPEGREVPGIITENLQEALPKLLQEKHDPEITTTIEKIEDEIKDKDECLVNMCLEETLLTSTKEVAIPSDEKTGNLQVSTLGSEIDKGKQNDPGELLNKERGAVQPQEQICNIKFVDSPSDVEIREQGELMHCGLQEPSEDEILLPQNDKKIEDSHILLPGEKEILQGVDKSFKEAPIIDAQKDAKSFDYPTKVRILDAVSNAECSEIEQQHLYIKEATLESINQENQSEQKKEADENIESEISSEKGLKQTIVHKEIANDILVMSGAKEEDRSNSLEDHSKEQEYYGEMTHQDPEAVEEPFQTAKLFDKVEKADPIDIQEETVAKGNLPEEETKERTSIIETTVNLHHKEKGDETDRKGTTTEVAIPIEDVNNSDVELQCEMDVPVPKCASARNPEVKSEDLKVSTVMDATADEAGYNKDPNNKTVESYEVEKEILREDMHLKSTGDRNKITEEISGMKQEPFNLPLTRERCTELDAPLTPDTAATEGLEIPQKYVTDDLIKVSQIQPEIQKYEVLVCTMDKQLANESHQNESMESKVLAGNIDASYEQGEQTAKSMNSEAEDLKAINALGNEQQFTSEVFKEEKMSDEKEKSETPEPAKILFDDILHESTKGNSEVAENLIGESEPAQKKEDQQVDKEETGDSAVKADEENEEEDNEENQNTGPCSDAPVMVEASKDMEDKVHKKSHNILSGVGSKVKHSIAKVKKAITGKSSHPKPPSPKERDEVIT